MDYVTKIKNFLGPSPSDFIKIFCLVGYFIIANVWSWYMLPVAEYVTSLFFLFPVFFFAFIGLLFGGLKGMAYGAVLVPGGFLLVNAAFFPVFFIIWLLGQLYGFLKTIPFPIVANVGNFVVLIIVFLPLLFLGLISIFEHRCGKTEPASDDSDDYSSPTFTGDLWGGRWG